MDPSEYSKMYNLEEVNWWYAGRRNLILKIVARIKNVHGRSLRILDSGCGTGMNLKSLKPYGEANGLDVSKDALIFSRCRGLESITCGSIEKLPFKNDIFDLVLALDVLEHIDDDLSAIREIFRVLRPDGKLIVTVPAFMFLWTNIDQTLYHKRRYTLSQIQGSLRLGGFKIEKSTYWNFFLFIPVAMVRLLNRFSQSSEEKKTDLVELHPLINRVLFNLLRIENKILDRFDLPFGISVICICRKNARSKFDD